MTFVIRRKDTGEFFKGRTRWRASWVKDLNKARIYPNRGNASYSLNNGFACMKGLDCEVRPVRIELADTKETP